MTTAQTEARAIDALVAEMRAGLEGVTDDGAWLCQDPDNDGTIFIVADNLGGLVAAALPWPTEAEQGGSERIAQNAAHIARCSPDNIAALLDEISALQAQVERLTRERDAARQALEYDRALVITACNAFNDAFLRRQWLLDSRGHYEWDDDRYRDEFKGAYDELNAAVEPLIRVGKNWSNCPVDHDEIMRSRQDWQCRAEAAEAEAARLTAELAEARKIVEPFAKHIDKMKFDIDYHGNPLPDDQAVGWIYVTNGDFRAARAWRERNG